MRRYHVVFTDLDTGQQLPDDVECWHDSLDEADGFACVVACEALTEAGLRLESAIFEDGDLHHEHNAPTRVATWN